jgi:hypothetical protein
MKRNITFAEPEELKLGMGQKVKSFTDNLNKIISTTRVITSENICSNNENNAPKKRKTNS